MRKMSLILLFLAIQIGLVSVSSADQFEVHDQEANKPMSNVRIKIDKNSYYTDSYGRVAIKLEAGTYRYKVSHKGRKYSGTLKLDNARYLKKLYLK